MGLTLASIPAPVSANDSAYRYHYYKPRSHSYRYYPDRYWGHRRYHRGLDRQHYLYHRYYRPEFRGFFGRLDHDRFHRDLDRRHHGYHYYRSYPYRW